MVTSHADPTGGYVVLVKGGVERVLDLCATQLAAERRVEAMTGTRRARRTPICSAASGAVTGVGPQGVVQGTDSNVD